ncbi:MAG: Stage sporulation family protein, partial [Acidimicrobiales bacterium]|nr:Stage sporulation family protein [Acidimicrobiales bacterium]
MRLRRRVQLLFVALFVILLAGVVLNSWVEIERDRASRTADDRLVPARDELNKLLTSLVDQETGQRGFLLTGDDAFLEPLTIGRRQTVASLLRLRTLLHDDPAALAGVDRVRSRTDAWQRLAADFEIDAKRSGRDRIVSALVASGTGRRLFEQVRSEIAGTATLLDARLAEQQTRIDQLHDRMSVVRIADVVAALALLALAWHLVGRWVTLPLGRLSSAVRAAASGALRDPIPASGPPDLAELASDIDAMRRRLLAEVDDAARARAALADRGMIVVTLRDDLAPTAVDLPRELSLAGRFRPAKGLVAGDWWDAVRLDDDRIALALIDVSGHGAEVATFALRTKALTMAAITSCEPGEALAWLADRLGQTGELFLTGVVLEVSASTGEVRYASAGHPPLLLAGLTGVTELPATGPLLGPLAGVWETADAKLDRGGVLIAYSDGLVEARNEQGELFGLDRLRHV